MFWGESDPLGVFLGVSGCPEIVFWECSGPRARFSKSPETFRARRQILKSKLVE